jgi:hypothetical protein
MHHHHHRARQVEDALQLLQATLAEAEGDSAPPRSQVDASLVRAPILRSQPLSDRSRRLHVSVAQRLHPHHTARLEPFTTLPLQSVSFDALRLSALFAYEVFATTREQAPAALAEAAQLLHTHALLVGGRVAIGGSRLGVDRGSGRAACQRQLIQKWLARAMS